MAEAFAGTAWRWLIAGELRAFPLRFALAALAIAVGVALGFAVHIVNRSAVDSFAEAVRSVSGGADLQVRGTSPLGFDERLYSRLMAADGVEDASPVVQLRAAVEGVDGPVNLIGLDPLRARHVTPQLVGRAAAGGEAALDVDGVYLSEAARAGRKVGERIQITVGARRHVFTLAGDLPGAAAGQKLAVIDISAAQWRFERLGRIDRVDLALVEGASAATVRAEIAPLLPAEARITDPQSETGRGSSLSRAYRVNLDMLALVALLTGGFLVYSAQSLSVARRARQFALLRTLGLGRGALTLQLVGEGAALGIAGAMAGLGLGYGLAAATLRMLGGDLGAGYFAGAAPSLSFSPAAAASFAAFGVATALVGSLAPARAAARIAPAAALKAGTAPVDPRARPDWRLAAMLAAAGLVAAFLPPVERLPLFGYAAVASVLAGGVTAMPWLARRLLGPIEATGTGFPPADLAVSRLLGAPGEAAAALGGIVASTALTIAMAVMVTSFRGSVDDWLESFLSADLYIGAGTGEDAFDEAGQARLAATPGIASIAFSKTVPVALDPGLPSLHLIVRPVGGPGYALPLIARAEARGPGIRLWLSEPAARLYDKSPGDPIALPLGGEPVRGHVAGIWRDYARQQGAAVIDERDYVALTGDRARSEAAVELAPDASVATVRAALAERLPPELTGWALIGEPALLRRQALDLFDRSFAITYALEAIAILIGLAGVAATVSAQTIARIREFGMLRHIGMTGRQILAMLAAEGALLGLIGGVAGAALGLGLSQILIHVINPQSFNWTMETRLPLGLIAAVAGTLVLTSAATAVLAGRRAVSRDALRAVSDDW